MDESKKKPWWKRTWVIILGGVVLVVLVASAAQNGAPQAAPDVPASSASSDLHASVRTTSDGIQVTNNESADWTDCFVGVNGSTGWGFDNPPYRTRGAFWLGSDTIPAGKTITVLYGMLTTADGTRFDIATHAVNTVVVACSSATRAWIGTL